jgi:transcriptional regulator with GAF, ATPase, and Fis domain/pSer/pThr/pTyr-binding forkhead associated (FHA) protein
MWRLRVLRGAAVPATTRIRDGLLIGRSPDADVICRDPLSSRMHAKVAFEGEAPEIVDLGSANGTAVNGMRAERRVLAGGDRITIGDVELVVEPDDGTESDEPTPPPRSATPAPRTTLRLQATVVAKVTAAMPVPGGAALAAEFASEDDASSRFHRFARGAARFAEADLALVLVRLVPGGPHVVAGRYPEAPEADPPPVPRALLSKAAHGGQALLLATEASDAAAPPGEQQGTVGTSMCAPIGPQSGGPAMLYVERRDPSRPYTTSHLASFAALATQAGPSLASELAWFRWRASEGLVPRVATEGGLVGESAAFLGMLDVAEHVAAVQAPVLVRGEPGSGRRLLARHLHERSRPRKPFLVVSCASLPAGDEKAALFGATEGGRRRPGLIEDAGSGTLCLAEVSDLATAAQESLAEAIAGTRYTPVAEGRARILKCRVVATTSRGLEALAAAGSFHPQLAAALEGLTIGVPPLSDRVQDVPLLAEHFASLHGRRLRGRPYAVSEGARTSLRRRAWPGQVAELSNAIEAAVLRAQRDEIETDDVETARPADGGGAADLSLVAAERAAIRRALQASRGRKGRAAQLLGI